MPTSTRSVTDVLATVRGLLNPDQLVSVEGFFAAGEELIQNETAFGATARTRW